MDKASLSAYLAEHFPQSETIGHVFDVSEHGVVFRLEPQDLHLRPGNTISGPTMMAMADLAAYGCILSKIGPKALAVTTNLSINFLHRPLGDTDIFAHASLLKLGKRLAVCEVSITQSTTGASEPTLVAHCTCTYSLPPQTSQ